MSSGIQRRWFITGTDTSVGKTWISAGLLTACRRHGLSALGLKPVASGCRWEPVSPDGKGRWVNEDALALMAASDVEAPYEAVNPCALELPVSPHLAAARAGVAIDVEALARHCAAQAARADACLVEGVGGWHAPLTPHRTVADLARRLGWPVILVVGIRLGCLNHALLSSQAILADGLVLAGWVANCVDRDCLMVEENIATLRQRLPAPLLGVVPWQKKMDAAGIAARLDIHPLLAPAA